MTEAELGQQRLKVLAYKPAPPRQNIKTDRLLCCEPLELEYLHGALAVHHEIIAIDAVFDRRDPVRITEREHFDIVLLTAYITQVNTVLRLAARLKMLAVPPLIFVGGPHAEVIPESFYSPNVDGVFFANQLEGVVSVLDRICSNQDYVDVPGAAFPICGEFKRNPAVPLNVNRLPRPSRDIFTQFRNRYRYMYYQPCASIKTSFGCGQTCTYCFCREMNGGAYTTRSIPDVMDEIECIEAEHILIVDDDFLSNRKRVNEFCAEIERRAIKKEFVAYGTAHFISHNPDLMGRLRKAGLSGIMVGLEFIADTDLKTYNKRSTTHDNDQTIDICHALDIELFGLFMVNPNWRHGEYWKLVKYLMKKDIFFAAFSTVTTLPGTELARQQGLVVEANTRWWRYDLLRLHQRPRYLSPFLYYAWLLCLYMLPGLRIKSINHLRLRYGDLGLAKQMAYAWLAGLHFVLKLLIWR